MVRVGIAQASPVQLTASQLQIPPRPKKKKNQKRTVKVLGGVGEGQTCEIRGGPQLHTQMAASDGSHQHVFVLPRPRLVCPSVHGETKIHPGVRCC